MIVLHPQHARRAARWFDLDVTETSTGLSIPAGSAWINGQEYPLMAYAPMVSGPFKVIVESVPGGADYLLDTTLDAVGMSFGATLPMVVAWRDTPTDAIHVLRSIP